VSRRAKASLAACLASVVGFAVVASLAFAGGAWAGRDAHLLSRLSAPGQPTGLADLVVRLGDPPAQLVLLAAAVAVAFAAGRRRWLLPALIAVGAADLTTQVLKGFFDDPRIAQVLGWEQIGGNSFPSGHMTAMVATSLAFALLVPRRWRPATLVVGAALSLAVGWSVIALRRHFPSDVAGGALVAAAWFFALLTAWLRGEGPEQVGEGKREREGERLPAGS
jgi:membrane-associated phospholipid phosphatase